MRWIVKIFRSFYLKTLNQGRRDTLQSGLPALVGDEEILSRFLNSKKQFSVKKEIVKHSAFLPNRNGQTSVFRHSGKPSEELWQIGQKELGEDNHIYGAGMVKAGDVRAVPLVVTASEPPPKHADIESWPSVDDPELAKAARKQAAMAVAEHATLLLKS